MEMFSNDYLLGLVETSDTYLHQRVENIEINLHNYRVMLLSAREANDKEMIKEAQAIIARNEILKDFIEILKRVRLNWKASYIKERIGLEEIELSEEKERLIFKKNILMRNKKENLENWKKDPYAEEDLQDTEDELRFLRILECIKGF